MPYWAQGTIRCEIDLKAAEVKKLFFTPSSDYSIVHGGVKYGVFIEQDDKASSENGRKVLQAIARSCDNRDIELCIHNLPNRFAIRSLSEVMCKYRNEVAVDECAESSCQSEDKLQIVSIVISAR